jgi:hypothetical protein
MDPRDALDGTPSASGKQSITAEVLKAVLDAIKTLSDFWRAVLLINFLLLLIGLFAIQSHPDLGWGATLGIVLISMTALLRPPPGNSPALANAQMTQAKLILPDSKVVQ